MLSCRAFTLLGGGILPEGGEAVDLDDIGGGAGFLLLVIRRPSSNDRKQSTGISILAYCGHHGFHSSLTAPWHFSGNAPLSALASASHPAFTESKHSLDG